MTVIDASALLGFLQGAPGADQVEEALDLAVVGDRLCLALAQRLDATVLTADRAGGESDRIVQLRP